MKQEYINIIEIHINFSRLKKKVVKNYHYKNIESYSRVEK